jgi:UDP-glucose 4-epimerase
MFVWLLIENTYAGDPPYVIYRPQNREPVCTSDLVKQMAAVLGRKIYFSRALGFLLSRLPFRTTKKLFGSLRYDPEETDYFENRYCVRSFAESVED